MQFGLLAFYVETGTGSGSVPAGVPLTRSPHDEPNEIFFVSLPNLRANERINAPQVRLIGADGTNYGVVAVQAARQMALDADLDLVEVSPDSTPPVCRIADLSKMRYEAQQKAKEARRGSSRNILKELKYRPAIDSHDYQTKTNWARKFIEQGHPVKITVMLRGREQGRPEVADKIFERLATDLADIAVLRGRISRLGRDVIGTYEPKK
jgi:translation initiation factor IF-3